MKEGNENITSTPDSTSEIPGKGSFWRRPLSRSLCLAILAVGILALTFLGGCWSSARTRVDRLLSAASLAPLPASATNVMYYRWNGIFTGETYAKFEANARDLQVFLANSPALRGVDPRIYDTNHQHVPFPTTQTNMSYENDYFHRHREFPEWYDFTIQGRGRKYVLPRFSDMQIFVDEERHIVWLRLIKG